MNGPGMVGWSATLTESRARAAVDARRHGVPPTTIETAARRRAVGDWRGACAAADVDVFFNPDSVRRLHGAAAAESLVAQLRPLAPDLLRWHLPRCGHGAGRLLEGLLIPLAEFSGEGGETTLTLAAATPEFALAAGERIVLIVFEGRARSGRCVADPAARTVLEAVHRRSAERYDLRRHRMFWDAGYAPRLRSLCFAEDDDAEAVLRMQDEGRAAEAWSAAGWDVTFGGGNGQWPATLPVNLPGLAQRVRAALPGADQAMVRCGGGTLILSGLIDADRPRVEAVLPRDAKALRAATPLVPDAVWARPIDADLLRLGVLAPHELHPLIESALNADHADAADHADHADSGGGPDTFADWRRNTTLGIEAQYADTLGIGRSEVFVRCGTDLHRVARLDGRWQAVDHDQYPARESLLARLGGAMNPCRTAAQYLGEARHVIELVGRLLEHGRADEATNLLRDHADALTAPEQYVLPDGRTVGQALDQLRQNMLRLQLIRSGAASLTDLHDAPGRPLLRRHRRSRKGEPARNESFR